MANVASPPNGLSVGVAHGARTAYPIHSAAIDENQPLPLPSPVTSSARTSNTWRPPPPAALQRKDSASSSGPGGSKKVNGNASNEKYDDIPENMYRPEKDDPEGWIHRDKLAKIESEELQAAGINLANARSRSQSRLRSVRSTSSSEAESKREEKRQRLQSPAEIEDEVERASWDFRLTEEIEAEEEAAAAAAASQIYSNPVLRKSGSKIPVMTSSPLPIPAERYERDTPIARKRTASGTISIEGDLNIAKTRNTGSNKSPDESDTASSAVASSKAGSPQKQRSKSITLSSTQSSTKKAAPAVRKAPAPTRATPSPTQRPGTRSGEQDRPRTSYQSPEGDPPWLATMYKPDPRLPPDQQLIPTLAKKQMQAQWAAEGAIPKAYDREFTPIDVHNQEDLSREHMRNRAASPTKADANDVVFAEPNTIGLKPVSSVRSVNGRPGTSGSITGAYSTMPRLTSPPMRQNSPNLAQGPMNASAGRSTTTAPPARMQATSLAADDDEKEKKACGCCTVM